MGAHRETYLAPPSALHYMLQALRPSPGWDPDRGFPNLNIVWRGYRIEPQAVHFLRRVSGISDHAAQDLLELLCPHVTGFRLLMAMLTHPSWPLPIWGALQVRNRLSMHSPLVAGDTGDLICRVAGWRVLEKGIEVDLQTQLQQRDGCAWESVITFYYRGRFGSPTEHAAALGAPPVSPVLGGHCAYTAPWRIDGHDRWRFGALTGDYNGIHQWDWYARRFGFAAAFAHPQRVAAQCLAHLQPSDSMPRTLDLWIKGPVYFGSEVVQALSTLADDRGQDFALSITNDNRPALVGRLHHATR